MTRAAFVILPLVLLSACKDPAPGEGGVAKSDKIWCAPAGSRDFTQDCALERGVGDERYVVPVIADAPRP